MVKRGLLIEDVVGAGGELHFAIAIADGALEQGHGAAGDDGGLAGGLVAADAHGGTFHFGQAAAIGADGDDFVGIHFQQYAAQGVAAAFVIGGEDGAADHFAEQAGGELVEFFFLEGGDVGEFVGVFLGQFPLAAVAADLRALAVAFQVQFFVSRFAQDGTEAGDGQDGVAGGFDGHAGNADADADFQVGGHQHGFVFGDLQLDVLEDGLGAAGWGHGGGGLEGRVEFFPFE